MTLIFITLAVVTAAMPVLLRYVSKIWPDVKFRPAPVWLPVAAGGCMLVSLALPDIGISGETDTFQLHFVGGGLYSACLYVYFKKLLGWQPSWPLALVALLAFVSTLGVTNELMEFKLDVLGIVPMDLSDSVWDLVANNTGALTGWMLLLLFKVDKTS